MKNLKEFKKLIKKYKSITIEQLDEMYVENDCSFGDDVLEKITGFGNMEKCTLCKPVRKISRCGCIGCVYEYYTEKGDHAYSCVEETYNEIDNARSAKELFAAIKNRVKFMKKILKLAINR